MEAAFRIRVTHKNDNWKGGVVATLPDRVVLLDCSAYATMVACEGHSLWSWGSMSQHRTPLPVQVEQGMLTGNLAGGWPLHDICCSGPIPLIIMADG